MGTQETVKTAEIASGGRQGGRAMELIDRASRQIADSFARQQSAFLDEHAEKAGAYTLALYPPRDEQDGPVSVMQQPVALIPHDRLGDEWPWEAVVAAELPHRVLEFRLALY